MQYKISDIAHIIDADRHGDNDNPVNWLLIDSRSLCFPAETLFFAIRTNRNDGHRYIGELYKRGVRNFVVSTMPNSISDYPDCNFLLVNDTLQALQTLASYHRRQFDIPIIAITGSNGKTTVKEWLYQLLSPDFNVCRSPRSYNSQVGVPLSLWLLNPHNDIAIIEAGISNPGEMDSLTRMIRPDISVITNIGMAHQENFLTREGKCDEKLKLFKDCTTAVINMQDSFIGKVARSEVKGKVKYWPMVREIKKNGNSTTVKFFLEGYGNGQYTIPFIDNAAIENSLTCLATCASIGNGIDLSAICHRMSSLEPVSMRLEVKTGIRGCILINDTYNSDIHSLDIALDFMSRRPDTLTQKRTLIISDILQSGEAPRTLYERVANMAASRGIDKVIGVGEEITSCAQFFNMESHFFSTTDELITSDEFANLTDEFILIKGARRYRFDRLSDLLTLKVHQTILEVNLNGLIDNLHHYRSFLQPDTKMVCMVKASGYGTGALETSKTLQDQGVDYLAVAVADEGADLRRGGITANIMVMNPEMTSFKMLFDHRLEPEIYSFQLLEALIYAAEKEGITNFPIHIKLDTGMHRLGFNPETDMQRLIDRLARQSALVPCSVFSHFAGSDEDRFDDFSHQQFRTFTQAAEQLQAAYTHKILRHICNTAGIEHFPKYQLDMVRLGLGLYGIDPRTNGTLSNVLTLKTTILQIRDVAAGETVGYSRCGAIERNSRIAAIPIGYADGLSRRLGNRKCHCMVNGKPAPYVGNICMDVCMIDVTDIECREGDQVLIFGNNLPLTTLSDAVGTIPYEILTGISQRVQRVYVQE